MRTAYLSGLILFSVLNAAACSSSSSPAAGGGTGGGGSSDGGKGAGGKSGISSVDGGCADPTLVFNGVDTCLSQAEATAQCISGSEAAQPGTKTTDPTCGAGCTCQVCAAAMLACSNDPNGYCPTILKCSTEKNCTGVGCYQAATCQAIIDQAPPCGASGTCDGISSLSVALATTVSDCATQSALYANRPGNKCAAACP